MKQARHVRFVVALLTLTMILSITSLSLASGTSDPYPGYPGPILGFSFTLKVGEALGLGAVHTEGIIFSDPNVAYIQQVGLSFYVVAKNPGVTKMYFSNDPSKGYYLFTVVPAARPVVTPAPTKAPAPAKTPMPVPPIVPQFTVNIINSVIGLDGGRGGRNAVIQITPYSQYLSIEVAKAGLRLVNSDYNGRFEIYGGVRGETYPVNIYYYSGNQKILIKSFNITVDQLLV